MKITSYFLLLIVIVGFSCCKKSSEPPSNVKLTDGLLAYYPFSNNFNDSTSNKLNAVATGDMTFTSDKDGHANSAASFNGTNAFLTISDNGKLATSAFTISFQYKTTGNYQQNLFSRHKYADGSGLTWSMATVNQTYAPMGDLVFAVEDPSDHSLTIPQSYGNFTTDKVQMDEWYQVICTFDAGLQVVYINGKLKSALTRAFTSLPPTNTDLIIGAWLQSYPALLKGAIDEVRVYNRSLNADEIAALAKGF